MENFLIDVPIPSMGATVSELTVIDIKVVPGARIAKGEKIAELESDKSVFEFEAPCDGTIDTVQARAGDILPSGAPFLRILTADISLKNLEVKGAAAAVAEVERVVPNTLTRPAEPLSNQRIGDNAFHPVFSRFSSSFGTAHCSP